MRLRKGRPGPLLSCALALSGASLVAAAWTGTSWYAAAHDERASYAALRDQVLAAGEQGAQNLNTLDHRALDRDLDTWGESTAGELHTQVTEGREEFARQIREARTVTTAKVLSGAVTELDSRAGRAKVLVALRITVTAPKSEPSAKESRLLGEVTRTGGGWKLSALGEAPVGYSTGTAGE
ncbi:hypothetical protein ACFQVC_02190 [Streptomyces monticola]|uniref:SnoaL-like domain-containing protein n=1 Tax=Streptomyces monticola TaxID=2666263 RepID=A0ABW2JAJ1_9ACTN